MFRVIKLCIRSDHIVDSDLLKEEISNLWSSLPGTIRYWVEVLPKISYIAFLTEDADVDLLAFAPQVMACKRQINPEEIASLAASGKDSPLQKFLRHIRLVVLAENSEDSHGSIESNSNSVSPSAEEFSNHEGADNTLWCTCKRKSRGTMIKCDRSRCEIKWFHLRCVGLKKAPKNKWFCSDCIKIIKLSKSFIKI